jgi:membrane peptidoglycan carboxypeptidase
MPKIKRIIRRRYRRQQRKKKGRVVTRRTVGVATLIALLAGMTLLAMSTIGATIAYASFTQDMPAFAELVRRWEQDNSSLETSIIYAWSDSEQSNPIPIYEIADPLGSGRQWVTLEQIPQTLIDTTIAIEEPTFWNVQGMSNIDLFRSFLDRVLLRGEAAEKSSLTQRIISESLFVTDSDVKGGDSELTSLRQMVEELLLTHRVSNSYTRVQILEWYLNTAYYGNLAYGVEAAARVYFDKPTAELTLAEAALLAPVPQAPYLNPIDNFDEAKQRQEQLLETMADAGSISRDILALAQFRPVDVAPILRKRFDVIAPHFALLVRQELEARFGPRLLLTGGLRVFTSLDLSVQQQAECVARAQINRLSGHIGADLPADEQESCVALEFLPPLPAAELGVDHDVSNAAVVRARLSGRSFISLL